MLSRDLALTQHLVSHLHLAYDPERQTLRLSVPAEDIRGLSPHARELFLETVVRCWRENCPDWQLEQLLLTLRSEEES